MGVLSLSRTFSIEFTYRIGGGQAGRVAQILSQTNNHSLKLFSCLMRAGTYSLVSASFGYAYKRRLSN